jgi:ribonuclease Y
MIPVIYLAVGLVLGFTTFVVGRRIVEANNKRKARSEADRLISKAQFEAQKIEQNAKNKARDMENQIRKNAENDIRKQKEQLSQMERSYKDKEKNIDNKLQTKEKELSEKLSQTQNRAQEVDMLEKKLQEKELKLQEEAKSLQHKMESISKFTANEAKEELVNLVKHEAELEAAKKAQVIENEAKAEAEKKAKRIISLAIARYAGEYAAERTVSVIALPTEEMKGRIIGKEGRNIRALEAACGVDLIVDETPEAVVISSFDPVRREIARRTIDTLLADGRVHPSRIEEVVNKEKDVLFKSIKEDGEKAIFELGIVGVNAEILKLLGSLKYRTSYTQNNYTHSIEVGFLAGLMAAEIGADVKAAQRAGVLHDIGKALDHSIEGSHAIIGADFARKHGEAERICHAIRAHHEDEQPKTVLAHLVQAADALSSARPGARKQTNETYVRRLEDLESIGNSFDGVIRTFALQAGREIRVIVEGGKVTDEQSLLLSRDIARKIEREMNYPGQIKVTVVRETRAVEYAR